MNYLDYRTVMLAEEQGLHTMLSSAGSILKTLLWNIYYNGMLKLELPEGVDLIAYADDLALVVRGRNLCDLEVVLNELYRDEWKKRNWMQLLPLKTLLQDERQR